MRPVPLAIITAWMCAAMSSSSGARAAETDPFYAWLYPPRDGADAINRAVNARMRAGLANVDADDSCDDAIVALTAPLASTQRFFFLSDMPTWRFDYSPRSSTEYMERFRAESSYRYLRGRVTLVPLDPTVSVGGILIGTDKIAHFFTNGPRHFAHYRERRRAGDDVDAALRAAVDAGLQEELTWLGLWPSGILSYADVYANTAGVEYFRSLCEQGGLRVDERTRRWTLAQPFDIRAHVTPCWDEAFTPNYYAPKRADDAAAGMRAMCTGLASPAARARRDKYRALHREQRGCSRVVDDVITRGIADGTLPDPGAWSVESLCGSGGVRPVGR